MAQNKESVATRLYHGEVSWDFIGRRKIWYALSTVVILIGLVSLILRGLNPSIDFKGGAEFQGPLNGRSISQISDAVSATGIDVATAQTTAGGGHTSFVIQTKSLTPPQVLLVENALVKEAGLANSNQLNVDTVGSSWGQQITKKAIEGLLIFLVAVIAYLSIRFEWEMAVAAILALIHDLLITAGIYSLTGLQVSPSTVIALLTILGYSLYDTVVVFDKVRENTQGIEGGSRMTFSDAANLAVNQTLVRSINTSIIALLPVIGLIVIGAGFLGAGSLDDLSVALLIGLATGAYSSIFIATPLLCDLKERQPTYQALAKRVAARKVKDTRDGALQPATAGAGAASSGRVGIADPGRPAGTAGVDDDGSPLTADAGALPSDSSTRMPASQRRRATATSRPGGRGSKSRKRR